MRGTNATTGKPLSGIDHLRQSITDILRTRLGTRIRRRTYGSRLPRLVDAPLNAQTKGEIYAATAEALLRWEPRIQLERVESTQPTPGRLVLVLTGKYLPDGQAITLDGIEVK